MHVLHKWCFPPPFGYKFIGKWKTAELVPDPDRFPILKKGWQLLATGQYSLKDLAEILYRMGLRTRGDAGKPAARRVSKGVLYRIYNNPFYYSVMPFNGELLPGSHEPMITKQVFDQCQRILRSRGNTRPLLKDFTYRGFLVCGEC